MAKKKKGLTLSEHILTLITGGIAVCVIGFGVLFIWLMVSL